MYLKSLFVSMLVLLSCSVFAQQLGDFVFSSSDSIDQQYNAPGSLGYQIYLLQTQFGEGDLSGSTALIQADALALLANLKSLSSYRVIDAMLHSQDKTLVFDEHMDAIVSALYTSNATQSQLQSEISAISKNIASCSRQEKSSASEYQNAMNSSFPVQNVDPMIMDAQTNAACVASNQTLLTAKQELLASLVATANTLGAKYDYLSSQKDVILDHFDLLNSDYLQQVLDVQERIQYQNY